MQYLNAIGGAILLDALPKEEITKITVDKLNTFLKGDSSVLQFEDSDEEYKDDADMSEESQPFEMQNVDIAYEYEGMEDKFVVKGDTVLVGIEDVGKGISKDMLFTIARDKEREDMNMVERMLLGKTVGSKFEFAKHVYQVKEIR